MPHLDRRLDPITGDYVRNQAGGWQYTDDASTALVHQIRGELSAWAGDPNAGSRLHSLTRTKSSLATETVVLDLARQALRPLVEVGRISEPTIRTDHVRDQLNTEIVVADLQTGRTLPLADLLPFNV